MGTMSFGYHYDMGIKSGYDIEVDSFTLWCVSYKDKNRIIKELKSNGYTDEDIDIKKVKRDDY